MLNRQPTIGLEIHTILKTRTKMFCDSLNDPEEKHPNQNVCPICLGHPGTLPVANKEAIEAVIKVGLALGGKISEVSKFDRKNYFYPDLPKGYQISQYDQPLVLGGELQGVRIRRIHLEEDAGRLLHEIPALDQGSRVKGQASYVDFNRAGVPLMELVTEPDIRSAEQAVAFGRELQLILQYLGVARADMEKGELRLEANVSLDMGSKVELKNINSFKAMGAAIEYEIKRQGELLDEGKEVAQETRGWNEAKQQTVSQRSKEEAHDYRYFPEPDLLPFTTTEFNPEDLRRHLPELPGARRTRFMNEYGLSEAQAEAVIVEPALAEYFEEAVSELKEKDQFARVGDLLNYLTSDLKGLVKEAEITLAESKVSPEHLAHLVMLLGQGKIMSRQAKDILAKMFETGEDPEVILKTENLGTISDAEELEGIVRLVMNDNPAAVADYKKGKAASLQFLVGQAMGKLKGKGDPTKLAEIFKKQLDF